MFRIAPILGKIYIPQMYFDDLFVVLEDQRFLVGNPRVLPTYIIKHENNHIHVVYKQVCCSILHTLCIDESIYTIEHSVLRRK